MKKDFSELMVAGESAKADKIKNITAILQMTEAETDGNVQYYDDLRGYLHNSAIIVL